MSEKLGFWAVFALVIGSQIGSGVFMLPSSLAPYGKLSFLGWFISGLGAICLALVFSGLCTRFPRTGGPHVYVKAMFGNTAAFFTGWTYWVISWVSTTAVVIASISYLSPFLGQTSPLNYIILELVLLVAITLLNLRGIEAAGRAEFILTLLKVVPLFVLPLIALYYFNADNLQSIPSTTTGLSSSHLSHVVLLTFWGFIGVETATTPAGAVHNPSVTIPKAIVLGTIATALIYLMNSFGIMGIVPSALLAQSKAPYVDASHILFGGNWHYMVAMIAFIVCVGTLNAWMMASGQIALGLSQDKLMPRIFSQLNTFKAPKIAIITSCMGIAPLLLLTANPDTTTQLTQIIDFSVVAFLFVYLISVLAFIKTLVQERAGLWHWFYTLGALFFCLWTVSQTSWMTIMTSSIFIATGLPIYFFWYLKSK